MPYPKQPRAEDPNADVRTTTPATPGVAAVPPLPGVSTRGGAPVVSQSPIDLTLPKPITAPPPQFPFTPAASGSQPDRDMTALVNRVVQSTPLSTVAQNYSPFIDQMKTILQGRYAGEQPGRWNQGFKAMPTEMAQLVTRQLFARVQRPELPAATGRVSDYMKAVSDRLGGKRGRL